MNLAQRITIGVSLLLMGLISYLLINYDIHKSEYVPYLLFIAFVGGGLFVLFGMKRKKKIKE